MGAAVTPASVWNSLECVKLAVSVLTPVMVLIVGLWVKGLAQKLEDMQWANRTLVEWRIKVYDEVAPKLNDLLCYFTFLGNWVR